MIGLNSRGGDSLSSSRRSIRAAICVAVAAVVVVATGGSASADSVEPISSYTDPRGDMPARPGQLMRVQYGPITIPAASEIHNGLHLAAPAPCYPPCYITDIVPNLVDTSGNTVNLDQDQMLHHFVLIDRS